MTLTYIGRDSVPTYTAELADINLDGKIDGANIIGGVVFIVDSAEWFIIDKNLELQEYVLPINLTVSDVQIGAVEIKDSLTTTRATVGVNGLHVDVQDMPPITIEDVATETTLLDVEANQTNGNQRTQITLDDSLSVDAFARLRISAPTNRFDVEFIYDKQPLIIDEVTSGGATATHDANARDVVLDIVNATNGTSAELISHYNIPYTPGNSQLVEITGNLDNSAIGGGVAQIFHRSKVSGSIVETTYDQDDWNISTEDDIDWSKSQIFFVDFQSLKVGRARFGFARNGKLMPVHQIFNDNIRAEGYWQYPSLPVRWRIYNDATYTYSEFAYGDDENAFGVRYRMSANANATMRAICATVKSEGGATIVDMPGYHFHADRGLTAKTVGTTKVPIMSIRPKATFNSLDNRMLIIPDAFGIAADNPFFYEVYYRPTLTGASWVSAGIYSGVEYDIAATAFSGGIKIASGYFTTERNDNAPEHGILQRIILSLGRTGVSDILSVVGVRTGTSSPDIFMTGSWNEIR